jgi:hypothetical protein
MCKEVDETSELGTNWGPSSPVPQEHPEVAAIKAASTSGTNFVKARGEQPDVEVERALADEAIRLINNTVGDSVKHRYVLVVLNMSDVDPDTTAATIESYSLVATSDVQSLISVAQNEAYKLALSGADLSVLEI